MSKPTHRYTVSQVVLLREFYVVDANSAEQAQQLILEEGLSPVDSDVINCENFQVEDADPLCELTQMIEHYKC